MPVATSPPARVRGECLEPSILLVDGFSDALSMYAECLRAVRLQPVECDNTADAFAHAERVDLIVTGIRVPGPFDGLELVRRLRAHDRTRRKPIIVLSACTLPRDQDAAREAGCSVFLPKPCLPDALSREVRRLLAAVSHSIGASAGRGRNCCVTAGHARQRAWIDVENWRQLAG